jgi:farnesyl-diphosphate farnesyltransferase
MRSTNPRDVGLIFCEYARKIHAKAVPSDPNFIHISIACGKVRTAPIPTAPVHNPHISSNFSHFQIEQWYEQNYPSFIQPPSGMGSGPTFDASDARTIIANLETDFNAELAGRKRMVDFANGDRKLAMSRIDVAKTNGKFSKGAGEQFSIGKMMMYVSAAFVLLIALGFSAAYGVMWVVGESV